MVVVHLSGGLGNQLFQYAAGRAVAFRTNSRLKLDTSSLSEGASREYRLNRFGVKAGIAGDLMISWLRRLDQPTTGGQIARAIHMLLPFCEWKVIRERQFHFDSTILPHTGDVYMIGYWQTPRYFAEIEDLLRGELKLTASLDDTAQETMSLINSTQSVGLHVRRGDYVADTAINRVHGTVEMEYYRRAVSHLERKLVGPHFFVFSDEPKWVQQNFHVDAPVTFVSNAGKDSDCVDLHLMSQCKHHVLANSSFSWWGAWLNPDTRKTVIAPAKWFNDPSLDTKDLLPDDWVRL